MSLTPETCAAPAILGQVAAAAYPVSPQKARNRSGLWGRVYRVRFGAPAPNRANGLAVFFVGDAGGLALELAEVEEARLANHALREHLDGLETGGMQ